eukprot:sb/3478061/
MIVSLSLSLSLSLVERERGKKQQRYTSANIIIIIIIIIKSTSYGACRCPVSSHPKRLVGALRSFAAKSRAPPFLRIIIAPSFQLQSKNDPQVFERSCQALQKT